MGIAFLVTSLVVVATPGTGAIYTIAAGLRRGARPRADVAPLTSWQTPTQPSRVDAAIGRHAHGGFNGRCDQCGAASASAHATPLRTVCSTARSANGVVEG